MILRYTVSKKPRTPSFLQAVPDFKTLTCIIPIRQELADSIYEKQFVLFVVPLIIWCIHIIQPIDYSSVSMPISSATMVADFPFSRTYLAVCSLISGVYLLLLLGIPL